MRRIGNLFDSIASFPTLKSAAQRASLGKRTIRGVATFLDRLEPEILTLERELRGGTWRPGRAFSFEIHDPKTRTITAAPFRDRVVHHALMDRLEPIFDRRMIEHSFACRRGKGTHAALRHARSLVRRHEWFLKLDIQKCFPSIRHDVVMATLVRIVKDRRVLALCAQILAAHHEATPGTGIPIGNLTSQWFANMVLDRLDHHVKEVLRVPGYVRYMDDFVLFDRAKESLRTAHEAVRTFVYDQLGLALKGRATILAPVTQGLPFLGFRVYRGTTRIRPENARRVRRRIRARVAQHREGSLSDTQLAASIGSMITHLEHGTTRAWRRKLFHESRGEGSLAPATA